jgi:pilus assembly protein CpaE
MPDSLRSLGETEKIAINGDFFAFVTDESSYGAAHMLGQLVSGMGRVQIGGLDQVTDLMGRAAMPGLILVDIDGSEDPLPHVETIAATYPAARILAVGSANDVRLYRTLQAAGVGEYLIKPLEIEDLRRAAVAVARPKEAAPVERRPGKVVAIVGVRGGVGASTLVINTGWLTAQTLNQKTVVLDLDLQFGTSVLALDLEPGRGLREALQHPNRLDSLLLASSMVNATEQLCVLGAEESLDTRISFDGQALEMLLKELRAGFACTLVDVPRLMISQYQSVLAQADTIILVSDLSLAGIRDTARIRSFLRSNGITAECMVVAAKVGKSGKGQVDRATFERGVETKLAHLFPDAPGLMTEAANSGKPAALVAPKSPFAAEALRLAERLCPRATAVKKSWLSMFKPAAKAAAGAA